VTLRKISLEVETEEVTPSGSSNSAFVRIHFESQAALNETGDAGHHPLSCALGAYIDVTIICVSHETVAASGELVIEFIQHDITQ
jgi:hypothetical protein